MQRSLVQGSWDYLVLSLSKVNKGKEGRRIGREVITLKNGIVRTQKNSSKIKIIAKTISVSFTKTRTQMFRAELLTIAKRQKEPKCPPATEWMNKCGVPRWWDVTRQ